MSIRAHKKAILAFLEQHLPGSVFDSYDAAAATGVSARRYAVVFIAKTAAAQHRYTSGQTRHTYTVTIHSVGDSIESCQWVQDKTDALTGAVLAVPGRDLHPVRFVTSKLPQLDTDSDKPMFFAVTQFDLVSDPM
ncbi:hypothetical protein [Canibacter oris]|uniref:DUF3168 domain-containing protein n=1 Tax=Canibacter oris TaxID=1365628 RepID=A0A840DPL9_9MICO|nr:hypothetical protein [Canibacter oris]MBB4072047.1 hypothetical protein [Canibacter oris]